VCTDYNQKMVNYQEMSIFMLLCVKPYNMAYDGRRICHGIIFLICSVTSKVHTCEDLCLLVRHKYISIRIFLDKDKRYTRSVVI
jgi:hypothetical protein